MLTALHVRVLRAAVIVAVLQVGMALGAAAAPVASPVEEFVRVGIAKGFVILNDHSVPEAQRRAKFRDFLVSLTDVRRIALFTLGPARRTATPDEVDRFAAAFEDYAVGVYESRLSDYAGQSLKVVGSVERAPDDYVVTTVLVEAGDRTSNQAEPVVVEFRVVVEGGRFVVVDLSIAGVWLAIEERDQFNSFLQQNQNNISTLIDNLRALTARLRGPSATSPPPRAPRPLSGHNAA